MPPIRFGLGGVPLGNEFEVITDEDAYKTLDAAWSAGVRYYDVSPWYGLGLAERRFGYYLHNKNRDGYILSSKVGKLLKASRQNDAKSNFPFSPSPNNEKREKLRAVAAQYGADRRTAALHFSAAPDVAAALIVGARSEEQVLANVTSMQARIPPEFWAELKRRRLIEKNAPTPAEVSGG
ncbi:MAG: aldo/keto reductase [Steroidobacteraceae bacterium]